ncbi:Glucosamine-6-phosphate deaminase [Pirellula sp. SH-Sr6A]|uniref:glucosamine-6-phosphate deaminase n=1 Tax=Pirellula sp. SH-Sr6A TaxID=1632865 RepID=UPI00078CE4DD|nr:glucosamine-6-phosphate deaminase [Pirellula sp. SH-Sr6A]AMV32323.1 Glucosamine-6-phosphate deaminase [Pirellula sp. SH-Sr6A]
MRVVILDSTEAVSRFAADQVAGAIDRARETRKPPVLGLATGGTPLGLYNELVQRYRDGILSFADVFSFNLDEYVGLPPEHDQSYHYYMKESLFRHIDIRTENTSVPQTWNCDLPASAKAYETKISHAGGIDLQVLGIGTDGHIGFNEVGSSLASRTRLKTLTRQTRSDNARYFASIDEVPIAAITMGIATILEARSILLLATGANKAKAVAGCVEGAVSSGLPASALQLHPNVTIVVDRPAASLLQHTEYYEDSERVRAKLQSV